jgi:hypothetical protein
VTLAGVGLSGTRSALVFQLTALLLFLFHRRIRPLFKAAGLAILAAGFLLLGGTLKERIHQMIQAPDVLTGGGETMQVVNFLTNNRLLMLIDGSHMLARFPLSGIGVGNFYNYRDNLHFRGKFYSDLALNQYLQVAVETGIPGLAVFIWFGWVLLRRSRSGSSRTLLGVIAVTLLFSNFLWFPESMLIIFALVHFASSGPDAPPSPRAGRGFWAIGLLLAVFAVANGAAYAALHPLTWCEEKRQRYDYGFWAYERNGPEKFRWTRARCGLYIFPDTPLRFRVYCGAPLALLPGHRQEVRVYWRGQLQRTFLFTSNREEEFAVNAVDGFMELRISPAFSPQTLGLGPDRRELGVRLVAARR